MHLFWRSLSEPGFLGLIDCQDFNTFVIRQMAANFGRDAQDSKY